MILINLFSIFDPASYLFNLNFLSIVIPFIIINFSFWAVSNKKILSLNSRFFYLSTEIKILLSNLNFGKSLYFISLIGFIIVTNFMGLFPYTFTYTRHMLITLTLSLPIWIRSILYGWIKKTLFILSHLIPGSTSYALIPFIVCVETIRIIIRPLTLAIRLVTNIIAGHLLITLLRNQAYFNYFSLKIIIIRIQIILIILEMGVSLVQAYVFSTLSLLYAIDSN